MKEKGIGVRDHLDWNVSLSFISILLIFILNPLNIEKKYAALDAHCLVELYRIIAPKIRK
jgi:hypothetical protein